MVRSLSAALVVWVATEVKDLPHSIHPTLEGSCWHSSVLVLVCCFSMILLKCVDPFPVPSRALVENKTLGRKILCLLIHPLQCKVLFEPAKRLLLPQICFLHVLLVHKV